MRNGKLVRVLIVEDDDQIMDVWARALSPFVCVLCASSIREALQRLDDADVLLLDWRLGDKEADVVLDAWVEQCGGPACVASGSVDRDSMYQFLVRGAYNALHKPVDLAVLVSVIRRYQQEVIMRRQLMSLTAELRSVKRALFAVGALVIGLAGPTAIPEVLKLLSGTV